MKTKLLSYLLLAGMGLALSSCGVLPPAQAALHDTSNLARGQHYFYGAPNWQGWYDPTKPELPARMNYHGAGLTYNYPDILRRTSWGWASSGSHH